MPLTAHERAILLNRVEQGDLNALRQALDEVPIEVSKLAGAGSIVASGTQAAVIADPTGGATTDAEARTAINAIINALQAFGIVASS